MADWFSLEDEQKALPKEPMTMHGGQGFTPTDIARTLGVTVNERRMLEILADELRYTDLPESRPAFAAWLRMIAKGQSNG